MASYKVQFKQHNNQKHQLTLQDGAGRLIHTNSRGCTLKSASDVQDLIFHYIIIEHFRLIYVEYKLPSLNQEMYTLSKPRGSKSVKLIWDYYIVSITYSMFVFASLQLDITNSHLEISGECLEISD